MFLKIKILLWNHIYSTTIFYNMFLYTSKVKLGVVPVKQSLTKKAGEKFISINHSQHSSFTVQSNRTKDAEVIRACCCTSTDQ